MHLARLSVLTVTLAIATPAVADPGPLEVHPAGDAAITVGAGGVALLLNLIKVNDGPDAWDHEWFGALDKRVRDNYSDRARTASDIALVTSVAIPAGFAIGATWDRAAGERALVFTESIAGTLLVTSAFKTFVARPRPYTYNPDPRAQDHARRKGRDARRSFFSGHTATAFAALAAGGALYAGREPGTANRAMAWGAGAVAAAATANWRIRAGEHFYSDVVVGALVGAAVGTAVPAIHTGGIYKPSGTEWAVLAGGLVLGVTLSELVPNGSREVSPSTGTSGITAELTPLVLQGGGGLGVVGAF